VLWQGACQAQVARLKYRPDSDLRGCRLVGRLGRASSGRDARSPC